ncbi:serine/threonine-protein kinase PknG [Nocardia sp. NBC_01730]|uniref:serine/threonine-protein kinase n=1 Tax=Nocardia sp. NBC_01730 TaxID=2975998 RepID=UPI002E0DA412|nr:serine/threonine-protein kinase PknG [Nocardia sp. NBC_01730]
MTCGEPGCGGIVEDGYCVVCGTAPIKESVASAPPARPAGRLCTESRCAGTIVDGYCDACGTAPTAAAVVGTRPAGRSARTSRSSSSSATARGRLGAGMVDVPRVPRIDPLRAVMAAPHVAESKRYCGKCEQPVGRTRDGKPGRTEGFCANCGTRFSFSPKLVKGDLIGGQYEVAGCLAHGGLGWIYLATDHRVNDRWVVLKGLLNSGDSDALRAAVAERRFLAEVDHPNIVKIHNFTEHTGSDGTAVGYIVMEYVGGTSLKQILRDRLDMDGSHLPPAQAIAYILEMLPALGYLHSRGRAYCDFKPDNVMQTDEQLKLIDLGAVIEMDDNDSPIYGTIGYQAPEIAETGPTVATEVYSIGRTLAVLIMTVPHQDGHIDALPGPDTEPLLAFYESLYRFLLRATDPDPQARFSSTVEMSDQLVGVLREVLSTDDGIPRPGMSNYFGPPRAVFGLGGVPLDPRAVIAALPVPLVDAADSGATLLATTNGTDPSELELAFAAGLRSVVTGGAESVEIPLRLVRAGLEVGAVEYAHRRLDELSSNLPGDWRLAWYRGQARLLEGDFGRAAKEFDAVYAALPGEPAPKLALAAVTELFGSDPGRAARHYATVWHTDHTFVSAVFGLARLRTAVGDHAGAVAVLDQVDQTSALFTEARIAAVEALLADRAPAQLTEWVLREAGSRVERLALDSRHRVAQIRMRVLAAALGWLRAGKAPSYPAPLLGAELNQDGVRTGLEQCYRELARGTDDLWTRIELVDKANAIRPRTTL